MRDTEIEQNCGIVVVAAGDCDDCNKGNIELSLDEGNKKGTFEFGDIIQKYPFIYTSFAYLRVKSCIP